MPSPVCSRRHVRANNKLGEMAVRRPAKDAGCDVYSHFGDALFQCFDVNSYSMKTAMVAELEDAWKSSLSSWDTSPGVLAYRIWGPTAPASG